MQPFVVSTKGCGFDHFQIDMLYICIFYQQTHNRIYLLSRYELSTYKNHKYVMFLDCTTPFNIQVVTNAAAIAETIATIAQRGMYKFLDLLCTSFYSSFYQFLLHKCHIAKCEGNSSAVCVVIMFILLILAL